MSLWEAAELERCEIADGAIEVVVVNSGRAPDVGPTLRVIPHGDDCEVVEFTAAEDSGILLVISKRTETE